MRLVELRLVRTPGIRDPFRLEPSSGLNLVTGPNGVGKSSICRAIRALLWPGSHGEQPFTAIALFESEGRRFEVRRQDLDPPVWSGPRPDLGPDHLAGRYLLGVLDLLRPDTKIDPLAREIRRHMAGGFDLDAIRGDLFGSRTGLSESRSLKNAVAAAAKLKAGQRGLAAERDRLRDLEGRRDQAGMARDRLAALEMLGDLIRHTLAGDEALAQLQELPPAAGLVRPEDPGKLADLRKRENEHTGEITQRTASIAAREKELADLESINGGPGDPPLALLRNKLETLVVLGSNVLQAEREASDSHLDEVLSTASAGPSLLPVLSLLLAGAALIAAGLRLPLSGSFAPWLLVAAGGACGGGGVWGLASYFRVRRTSGLAFEKRQEIARKKDHLAACRSQWEEALSGFNEALAGLGVAPVSGSDEAAQRLEDLDVRRDRMKSLRASSEADREYVAREGRHLDRVRTEILAVHQRLGLAGEPKSDAQVSLLLELKPRFARAVQTRDEAAREIERLEKGLAAAADLLRTGETTLIPAEALAGLIEQEKNLANELVPLEKEIARIEALIGQAQDGHDLQEALAAQEAAGTALAVVRQTNRQAACGRLLLDRVELQHELESRPRVLARADAYFSLFTGHRYTLKLAAQGEGEDRFLAVPEDAAAPLELDQLSDGTRAQLLLAVKLAFITAGEEGSHPPIFLDDSLTSADPERFAAVAASLGRVAAEDGRQIFYLTPDPAAAAAFQRSLARAGLDAARLIDLAAVRGTAGAADPALLDPDNLPTDIMAPLPSGMNAAEYAQLLRISRPDPWAPAGALHVLYLLGDDLELVRRLVDGNGATLNRLAKSRNTLVDAREITSDEAAFVAARGEVWRNWLDGWRIGRARPVTREFLQDSAAVSNNYLAEVTGVLDECGWDGGRLLEAIDARQVKGFRSNKREQLRQELEDGDLLAHGDPLDDEDLISHTLERVAPLLAAGILDMQRVRTLALTFARLVAGKIFG